MKNPDQIPDYLPEHLREFYGVSVSPFAKYLNCHCMAVLFHLPQFLNLVTEDIWDNSELAKSIIHDRKIFRVLDLNTYELAFGDLMLVGAYSNKILSPGKTYTLHHSQIFVSPGFALSKPSYGNLSYELDTQENIESQLHSLQIPGREKDYQYLRKI